MNGDIRMTPLDKSLKRALTINGDDYVVTLTPDALKITRKGHRLGVELKWADLVSGQSALAVALHASVGKFQDEAATRPEATNPKDAARRASTSARRAAGQRIPKRRAG
jgi:hypothetical protein